jgi:uncharacterized protein YwgA
MRRLRMYFIRTNYYEEINQLMSDWSSNWKNNNFNLRTIIENNKKKRDDAYHRIRWTIQESKNNFSLSKLMSFEFLTDRKQLRIKIDENRQQYYKQYQISIKKRAYNSSRMRINDHSINEDFRLWEHNHQEED